MYMSINQSISRHHERRVLFKKSEFDSYYNNIYMIKQQKGC